MEVLALKVVLAPALVVGATLAGRRWGSRAAGFLVAIPVVAGPILLVITIEHGEAFGARAARGVLLGIVALSAFSVIFARAARLGWLGALAAGWTAFATVALIVSRWDAPPVVGLAVALAALGVAGLFLRHEANPDARPPERPWWDLYARAGLTAALVVTITSAAHTLGPALSGVLTPFPIAVSVVAAFTVTHDGPRAAATMLRGFVTAMPGFAVFFFVVAVLLD